MSAKMDRIVHSITKAMKASGSSPVPYDTQAKVLRVEDNIAWVHIPGGVEETPVQKTLNAKEGDVVQIRVSGGRAWLTGNITSPPTDDSAVTEYAGKTSKEIENINEEIIIVNGAVVNAAALVYDHLYEMASDGVTANFTAYLYEGKKDITRSFPPENYTWYKKTEDGMVYIGSGYTISVDTSELGFGGTVTGRFTSLNNTGLTDTAGNGIQTGGGDTLTGRAEAEGFVKVTDLPVQAPAMTDKLLGIGAEQEYQMAIEDLKDLIGGAMTYGGLDDKPSIEGVTLEGDKSYEDLNLQSITNAELENILKI